MSSELISQPAARHHCGVNRYGFWSEARPLSPDSDLYAAGYRRHYVIVHDHDAPGAVRACGECGRIWMAHRRDPNAGWAAGLVEWRPETRFQRWRRQRRTQR